MSASPPAKTASPSISDAASAAAARSPRGESATAAAADGLTPLGRSKRFTFEERRQSNRQSALLARRASIKLDVASFAAETYLPEYYLKSTMGIDADEAIQTALRSLGAARDKSMAELKRAVYKNHVEFLAVSREMLNFEGVLSELGLVQSQLRTAAHALVASSGIASFISLDESSATAAASMAEQGAPGTPKRTLIPAPPAEEPKAIVDWEARRAKMLSLAENIADFDKHITKDRHLIFEGGGMTEQVGISSPKSITLFLFNDAIAMASRKSRMVLSGSTKRLVLERLWPMREIAISDVPDSKSLTNAFKVTRGGEYVLLQAETATGKRLWLQQIAKTQRANEEPLAETATAAGGSRSSSPKPPSLPGSPGPKRSAAGAAPGSAGGSPLLKEASTAGQHRRVTSTLSGRRERGGESVLATTEASLEKLNALGSLLDALNAEIDECSYERAAEIVDKIKFELGQMDSRSAAVHQLAGRLQGQVSKLAAYLYHEITDLIISKEEMARFIQLLVLLGYPDEAREKFLAARSDSIKDRTKHLRYTGDVAKTVSDIGFTTFQSIRSTADWYISSFKDNPMTAGFVFWAKLEMNNYVNIIVKQVFAGAAEADFHLMGECVATARRHAASLGSIGLDLVFYLDDQLLPHIDAALRRYQSQLERSLAPAIAADDYLEDKVEAVERASGLKGVTSSCLAFHRAIIDMLNDVEPLLRGEAMSEIMVGRVASLFENYSTSLLQATYAPELSVTALLNIFSDVAFLASSFLPSLRAQLEDRFNRTFADLRKLQARLEATLNTMGMIFAEGRASQMVPSDLSTYSAQAAAEREADLSDWLVTMLPLYAKISRDLLPERRLHLMPALLTAILGQLTRHLDRVKFSATGVQQCLLDVHFLMLVSRHFLTEQAAAQGTEACAVALKQFKQTNVSQQSLELPNEELLDQQARSLAPRFPLDFGS